MFMATFTPAAKILSVFGLVMINVIAIDSLRTLPIGAVYGFSLVFFYLVAALVFFIPTILVTAELATAWPNTGGAYIWVREAFGPHCGFMVIWLQWIYNVVWYPTILAFIGATLAYLFDPALANNKYFLIAVVLISFWGSTWINCLGLKVSSWFSTVGALIGTLIPMTFIIILGIIWFGLGKPMQIDFSYKSLFPDNVSLDSLAFLTGIVFGLMGMEMSAVHAGDVRNPQRDYPRALLYSGIIILASLILSSLAIAIVIPHAKLSVLSGLIDAFAVFFASYHLNWLLPVIVILIIVGGLGGLATWVMGPTRALGIALQDKNAPAWLQKTNQQGMPRSLLILQGVIVTLLTSIFLLMPTVNSSYWVLTVLSSQLALIFYIFLFATAIRLHYKHAHVERFYRIPGGKAGIWVVSGLGILGCLFTIIVGFIPPTHLSLKSLIVFESVLVAGIIIFCTLPLFIFRRK